MSSDIDECLDNPCDTNASCLNINGGFNCTCDNHFNGNGFNCTRLCENGYQLNETSMVCGEFQWILSTILHELHCLMCTQNVVMVISDLWTVRGLVKVELKSASTIHMAASVLTFGMKWMPRLSVDSWDS